MTAEEIQDETNCTDKKPSKEEFEWTVEMEVELFHAMVGHKPVGINRSYQMACILDKFSKAINKDITSSVIWAHLDTMYDMAALHDSEIIPFPTGVMDFSLPEEFHDLMNKKREERLKEVENGKIDSTKNSSTPNFKATSKEDSLSIKKVASLKETQKLDSPSKKELSKKKIPPMKGEGTPKSTGGKVKSSSEKEINQNGKGTGGGKIWKGESPSLKMSSSPHSSKNLSKSTFKMHRSESSDSKSTKSEYTGGKTKHDSGGKVKHDSGGKTKYDTGGKIKSESGIKTKLDGIGKNKYETPKSSKGEHSIHKVHKDSLKNKSHSSRGSSKDFSDDSSNASSHSTKAREEHHGSGVKRKRSQQDGKSLPSPSPKKQCL